MKKGIVGLLMMFLLVHMPTTVNAEEATNSSQNDKTEVQEDVTEYIDTVSEREKTVNEYREKIQSMSEEELKTVIQKFEESETLTDLDQELKTIAEEELQISINASVNVKGFAMVICILIVVGFVLYVINTYEEADYRRRNGMF